MGILATDQLQKFARHLDQSAEHGNPEDVGSLFLASGTDEGDYLVMGAENKEAAIAELKEHFPDMKEFGTMIGEGEEPEEEPEAVPSSEPPAADAPDTKERSAAYGREVQKQASEREADSEKEQPPVTEGSMSISDMLKL